MHFKEFLDIGGQECKVVFASLRSNDMNGEMLKTSDVYAEDLLLRRCREANASVHS